MISPIDPTVIGDILYPSKRSKQMDASRSTRKYPSYTTAELAATVAAGVTQYCSAEKIADIAAEVAARNANISVYRPTPVNHGGGIVIPRLGRM